MNPLNELIISLRENRVIPFIGSGFSQSCGFPSWYELIQHLIEHFHIDDLNFESNADLLRIAEYIKIISGGEIGPIRAEIEKLFNSNRYDISQSDIHLNLVSLGSPIIYTTNYDNLIEEAFAYLDQPITKIVTTRDIVKAHSYNSTQIVKFHGSFEYEKTIVLTESDYFSRLEFESPIDIKLRADIIGKGILFLGYSFSDYNIRYLWFKLKNMMNTVNELDKPKSFIVLADSNNMMSTLFQNLGIIPIHLSDYDGFTDTERLNDFLERLIYNVHQKSGKFSDSPIFATNSQIEKLQVFLEENNEENAIPYINFLCMSHFGNAQLALILQNDWEINSQLLGNWFYSIEKSSPELRISIITLLYRLDGIYGINSFYDIFIICFLRYPECREIEINRNWVNLLRLQDGFTLEHTSEFQILFDALVWIKLSRNIKNDTTFYYIYIIYTYFKERLNEVIIDPCDYSPEHSQMPIEYFNITPLMVLEYYKMNTDWLPDVEFIIENIGELDRILGSLGGLIHQVDDFDWNYRLDNKEFVESILLIS